MTQTLGELTQALLDQAMRAGADAADAIAVDGTSVSIDVREGALEHAERSEGVDIGLRVLIGKRQATVSASDTRPETLATMAERAVAMARLAPEDPFAGLADPAQLIATTDSTTLDLFDPSEPPSPEALKQDALRAEAAARRIAGISKVEASAAYGARRVHLAATNGFSGGYRRTDRMTSAVAIAGEGTGMERDYCGESRIYGADLPDPEEIGRRAAERTVARLGARKPKTGASPILYDERVSSSLIGHLLAAINGSAIARGASWLRDAMDEPVLPEGLSLVEDPHRPRTAASRLFDAEGIATRKAALVQDGRLMEWVLDLGTARKLGLETNGHAARGVSSAPSPSVTNVELTQGNRTRDELMREMGTGLLVTSMIGASINPTTGDYSRGANGFWVENGEIAYPVNECTIAGNLREMLRTLVPANDARTYLSRVVPSLLIEGMTVAGE